VWLDSGEVVICSAVRFDESIVERQQDKCSDESDSDSETASVEPESEPLPSGGDSGDVVGEELPPPMGGRGMPADAGTSGGAGQRRGPESERLEDEEVVHRYNLCERKRPAGW